jgi:F0F1-type ATP synthase epsilon subunit
MDQLVSLGFRETKSCYAFVATEAVFKAAELYQAAARRARQAAEQDTQQSGWSMIIKNRAR